MNEKQEPSTDNRQPTTASYPGRVAAIDYGTIRIGVALSDRGRILASPFEVYQRQNQAVDARYFQRLVENEEIRQFVVGLPIHLDGRESEKSIEARAFGEWLARVTGVPVEYFDERYTSTEAQRSLADAHLTRKRKKKRLDAVAAQILLAAYLESSGKQSPPQGLD